MLHLMFTILLIAEKQYNFNALLRLHKPHYYI